MTPKPSFLSRVFRFCERRVDTLLGSLPENVTEEFFDELPWRVKLGHFWTVTRVSFYATIVLTIFYFFPYIDTE